MLHNKGFTEILIITSKKMTYNKRKCLYCEESFEIVTEKAIKRYCSDRHRVYAYRERLLRSKANKLR